MEAQEQFKANLSTAESDFSQLAALDKKIKSFNIGPNPYTWYTVCTHTHIQFSLVYQQMLAHSQVVWLGCHDHHFTSVNNQDKLCSDSYTLNCASLAASWNVDSFLWNPFLCLKHQVDKISLSGIRMVFPE